VLNKVPHQRDMHYLIKHRAMKKC